MKTKFIKVPVSDRLPNKNGYYFTDEGMLGFRVDSLEWYYSGWKYKHKVNYWLEEVPDLEDEYKQTIELYKQVFEEFIPLEKQDEAQAFLSSANSGLAKHLQNQEK